MNALRRRFLKFATLLGAVALLWACNAPFIPVPPPGATFTSELVDDGAGGQKTVWITHGLPVEPTPRSRIYIVFNETPAARASSPSRAPTGRSPACRWTAPWATTSGSSYETPAGAQAIRSVSC